MLAGINRRYQCMTAEHHESRMSGMQQSDGSQKLCGTGCDSSLFQMTEHSTVSKFQKLVVNFSAVTVVSLAGCPGWLLRSPEANQVK